MSGHSKWATIKRQKGAADVKRGLTFTKISNAITVAVKKGAGITTNQNFRLRLAVEEARASNMPKDTIERAIQRAVGKGEGAVEEVIYEGFAPNGISVIIEAATDNSQRTTSEIKSVFSKENASFGQPGSVSYQFKQLGRIIIKKNNRRFDEIFEQAAEAGAEDIEEKKEEVIVYTNPADLDKIKDLLVQKELQIAAFELVRKPIVFMPLADKEKLEKTINFLHKLEELDDVQKVYSNLDVYQE